MDKELEQELVESYPDIFSLYTSDPEEINGPPPQMAIYGFQCDNGWYDLLVSLCEVVERHDVKMTVTQVKEKYGGLRVYHNGIRTENDRRAYMVSGAIQHAQEMSYQICETCGESGELRQDDVFRTLCDSCYEPKE